MNEHLTIVIAGHVDHGKSTIIGRLLADSGSLPTGKLEFVKSFCEKNARPFEYAFLLDALKDEQSQGITIDSARVFFHTNKRNYCIIDAPGHVEFLKNMVSGASRAEAALLVIDAAEGVRENSRRHGYMLSMLGIKQIAVLVNKMDSANYSKSVYDSVTAEYSAFLKEIGVTPFCFIPVSGLTGENIAGHSGTMRWYTGNTVIELLDTFVKEQNDEEKPFRMPVQDIYRFTESGDTRRIIAGTVASGKAHPGDELIFYPSGKRSRIRTFESFNTDALHEISSGMAAGFTLEEQIYVKRGETAAIAGQAPPMTGRNISVTLFWLGKKPFIFEKKYFIKMGTAKAGVSLTEISRIIDASDLRISTGNTRIERNDVAECTLTIERTAAFDLYSDIAFTGRFVIVDEYEIAGGGVIHSVLPDDLDWIRSKVFFRNYKWEKSFISQEERAERYGQKPMLLLITGAQGSGKKSVAKRLERLLFTQGKIVYYLGIGNVKHGIDADIDIDGNNRLEHLRRTAETAHILLDAGCILIVTCRTITDDELEIFKSVIAHEFIRVIGTAASELSLPCDLTIPGISDIDKSVEVITELLI